MYNSCKANLDQIDPRNFESSINMLSELDAQDKAQELFEEYFRVNEDKIRKKFADHPHSLPMSYEVKSAKMKDRLNLIKDQNKEVRSIKEIAKKVTFANGWNPSDIDGLASHSIDDYEDFIRETKSDDLSAYIKRLIKFGDYQNPNEKQKEIKEKTIVALKRICQDGSLNKLRIESKFNIEC